jgi:FkbM family methyltransferase
MTLSNYLERAAGRVRRDTLRALRVDALTGLRIQPLHEIVRLGSNYGGWNIPADFLRPDSVCYCVGAGEDISFDFALIERYGCEVHTFDPTPRAIKYVRETASCIPRLRFHPIGLWDNDEVQRFYAPTDPRHVSYSAVNLQKTNSYFEASCRSLPTIMRDLGHERLDLLKLDIEGAEHRVIASLLAHDISVSVLCVEFDEAVVGLTAENRSRIRSTAVALREAGYVLVAQEGRSNYTFARI